MRLSPMAFLLGGSLVLAACSATTPVQPVARSSPFTIAGKTTPVSEDCKVTGGGFIVCGKDKITFGFNAQFQNKGTLHGNIEVNDHSTGARFHSNDLNVLWCTANSVTFGGILTNGDHYVAYVEDNGEPGRRDVFSFASYEPTTWTQTYSAQGNLGGGNIQIHH